jgi:transitional endoplasmic reticulum ATPase
MLFQKGQNIDTYTVVFPHKEGSYAETYRVRNRDGKLRFLKLIFYSKLNKNQIDENGEILEIEIAKQLKHRNLCRFEDSGKIIVGGQNLAYFVTEFVSSETLDKKILRDGDLSVFETKEIAKTVLSALQYLHGQSVPIIHNEITIQNILLNLSGELQELKLIDFGHARFLNQKPAKPDLKEINPFYLAPEMLNGVCSIQSDLYSVGVLIYNLLFGTLPWFFDISGMDGDQIDEKLFFARLKGIKFPNVEKFELDENLLNIISKALSNDISDRFQSAAEFIKALDGEIVVTTQKTKSAKPTVSDEKPKRKSGGFADVAGMKELKEQLQSDVISLLQNPEQAKSLGLSLPNGLLFYGPPGCGKTFFAEKFAEETGFNYQYVKGSDVASPYIDGGKGKIADIFNEARKNAPTILFLDEVDSIIRDRNDHNNVTTAGAVNEFLMQLNNCGKDNVLVIGATNKPTDIDEAALRAGRLELKYYIPQPDFETRKEIFKISISKRKYDFGIDYDRLAGLTENYISADISLVIDTAARLAFRRGMDKITMALLEEAISETKPSLTAEQIRRHEEIRDRFMGIESGGVVNSDCFSLKDILCGDYELLLIKDSVNWADDFVAQADKYVGGGRIRQYLGGVESGAKLLKSQAFILKQRLGFSYTIRYKNKFAGAIWVNTPKLNLIKHNFSDWDVSYFLFEPFENKGIMTFALSKVIDLLFFKFGIDELVAVVENGNLQSEKLLKKIGFEFSQKVPNMIAEREFTEYKLQNSINN